MRVVSTNCPACGGIYGGAITSRFITCEYCGTRFALSEEELRGLGFTDADGDGFDDEDVPPRSKSAPTREEDTNRDPMEVFARDECERFMDEDDIHASDFKSTKKVLRGLSIPDGDDVYLIHDDTLFSSGKDGFAITDAGIYCREMGEWSAHFVSWDTFMHGKEPREDGGYVRQGETSLSYFTGNDEAQELIFELILRLWKHAQKLR